MEYRLPLRRERLPHAIQAALNPLQEIAALDRGAHLRSEGGPASPQEPRKCNQKENLLQICC